MLISHTNMYLTGDAKLWWHTCLQDDENENILIIETWESLEGIVLYSETI